TQMPARDPTGESGWTKQDSPSPQSALARAGSQPAITATSWGSTPMRQKGAEPSTSASPSGPPTSTTPLRIGGPLTAAPASSTESAPSQARNQVSLRTAARSG